MDNKIKVNGFNHISLPEAVWRDSMRNHPGLSPQGSRVFQTLQLLEDIAYLHELPVCINNELRGVFVR